MSQWSDMAKRWDEWGPPLRPSPEDVRLFAGEARATQRNLLLGSTPELQSLAFASVDSNESSLRVHARKGLMADWRRLPFRSATFDSVIGDGSLNVFEGDPSLLFNEVRRVLDRKSVV
jgi:hypothetical protein